MERVAGQTPHQGGLEDEIISTHGTSQSARVHQNDSIHAGHGGTLHKLRLVKGMCVPLLLGEDFQLTYELGVK